MQKGTTFDIYIPASTGQLVDISEPEYAAQEISGRILIMDDEIEFLETIKSFLVSEGFEVECAENGEQAIECYKQALSSGKPFNMAILDLTIPGGMGGKVTLEKLKDIDPHIKAIVSSGYSHDKVLSQYKEYGFLDVLPKPYEIRELKILLQKHMNDK